MIDPILYLIESYWGFLAAAFIAGSVAGWVACLPAGQEPAPHE